MTLLPSGCWQETTTGEQSPALRFGTGVWDCAGTGVPMSDAVLTRMSLQGGTSAVVSPGLHQHISPAWCCGPAGGRALCPCQGFSRGGCLERRCQSALCLPSPLSSPSQETAALLQQEPPGRGGEVLRVADCAPGHHPLRARGPAGLRLGPTPLGALPHPPALSCLQPPRGRD